MLTYGPNGVSRGIATIIFTKPGDANNAVTSLNGVLVDKRPMKVYRLANRRPRNITYIFRLRWSLTRRKLRKLKAWTNALCMFCHILPTIGLTVSSSQPKSAKPKPATEKPATNATTATRGARTARGGRGGRRGRNAGRPKPKTMDELDAEMVDYFDGNAVPNGAAAPAEGVPAANGTAAAGGDELGMEEISVRLSTLL